MKVGETVFHRGLGKEVKIKCEYSSHFQCADENNFINASKVEGVDLTPVKSFAVLDGGKKDENQPIEKININEVSSNTLGKALKGIGQLAAKKIIGKKPDGGYSGFEQLKTLNADLNINWEAVLPHIEF
jgi:DNA uptake protein ComE-like DNA-binding protein